MAGRKTCICRCSNPAFQAGEVLERIHAASVNPIDLKNRASLPIGPKLPGVLGRDFSGVVKLVSEGVDSFCVSDEVYGCAGRIRGLGGTFGEFIVCDPALITLASGSGRIAARGYPHMAAQVPAGRR
ncbi:alcohol dehydrogenase catalytic domain-containing protein [Pseudomonas veronii]|uniref:alcohol dehydrogenase catalytic domain-containing protein n=1 Tax=Pseudomonas veronii TaxID=76761 RepID=UPI0036F1C9A7